MKGGLEPKRILLIRPGKRRRPREGVIGGGDYWEKDPERPGVRCPSPLGVKRRSEGFVTSNRLHS